MIVGPVVLISIVNAYLAFCAVCCGRHTPQVSSDSSSDMFAGIPAVQYNVADQCCVCLLRVSDSLKYFVTVASQALNAVVCSRWRSTLNYSDWFDKFPISKTVQHSTVTHTELELRKVRVVRLILHNLSGTVHLVQQLRVHYTAAHGVVTSDNVAVVDQLEIGAETVTTVAAAALA